MPRRRDCLGSKNPAGLPMLDTSVMFLAATPASVRPGFRPTRGSVVDGLLRARPVAESTAGTADRGHRQRGGRGGERSRPGERGGAPRSRG